MNIIVTTTIQSPSFALSSFLWKKDWTVIVVGDKKTPHHEYEAQKEFCKNLIYMTPDMQDKLYPNLSAVIGWNTIQRRNIGYVHAYNLGAKIIATIDDDNIPYDSWGQNFVNQCPHVNQFECETEIFDPLSATNHNYLWHRGFPIQLVSKKNNIRYKGKWLTKVGVQADLWDGDPDIDAHQRITVSPCVKFDTKELYKGPNNKPAVFDSQNTFLSRECFPFYFVMPFVGRMDDIFGGYYMQVMRPDIEIVFGPASVYQARNDHDLRVDMKKEYIGYENALEFVQRLQKTKQLSDCVGLIPKEVLDFQKAYTDAFKL